MTDSWREMKTFRASTGLVYEDNVDASPACLSHCSVQSTSRLRVLGKVSRGLASLEGIERLVGVPDEGQAHLGFLGVRHGTGLRTVNGAGVLLRNFVDWEVRDVNVRAETRLEWRANATQLLPDHAAEEWVVLDLRRTTMLATLATNTVLRVTQEAVNPISIRPCLIMTRITLTFESKTQIRAREPAHLGSKGIRASSRSCGKCRWYPQHRMEASQRDTRT